MREVCRSYLAIVLCLTLIPGQFAPLVQASSSAGKQSNTSPFITNPLAVAIANPIGTAPTLLHYHTSAVHSFGELAPPHRGNLRSNGSRTRTLRADANTQSQSANLPGQSSTVLPDGRLLVLGGESKDGPVSTGFIKDLSSGQITQLPTRLLHARAYHTATILPDGSVFIFGGVQQGSEVEKSAEIFDPSSLAFQEVPTTGLTARSCHSATVLTDGRLLIAGGLSENAGVSAGIEFWNSRNQTVSPSSVKMLAPRRGQTATLLPDGSVLFWGGFDKYGDPLTYGEVFDPSTQTTRMQASQLQHDRRAPLIETSIPQNGDQAVALDSVISVRFSEPLQVQSLNASTVILSGPDINPVTTKVVPAEAGMLVFVTPQSPLLSGQTYSLMISDAVDSAGQFVSATTITFTTASTAGQASDQTGIISSGSQDSSDPLDSTWRKLTPLQAPSGGTALAGQTLQLNGQPLSNVTLTID